MNRADIETVLLLFCPNCDGRKCMDCVFRAQHDRCEDSCSDCCELERVTFANSWRNRVPSIADQLMPLLADVWDEGATAGFYDRELFPDVTEYHDACEMRTENPYREEATDD